MERTPSTRKVLGFGLTLTALVTITFLAHGRSFAQSRVAQRIPYLIEALNDCVQERFKEVEASLGFARVTRLSAPHLFTPERVREVTAVDDLNRARLHVVLYLAGREVLKPKPEFSAFRAHISEEHFSNPLLKLRPPRRDGSATIEWGTIKGPIRVTPVKPGPELLDSPPIAVDLWDDTQRAMRAFARSESHDFTRGGWNFAARPIRVTDDACLNCHTQNGATLMSAGRKPGNKLRMGDAVGAMVYGYKRMP